MAAESYGNQAEPLGLCKASTHTLLDPTVSTTAMISPTKPPVTAPLVVQSFHSTDMNSTGKLAEAATTKASITMKATFSFSKAIPKVTAMMPRITVVILETRSSSAWSTRPFLHTDAYRSCDTAVAPDSVRPATTARMVANATAEIKPMNTLPPTALDRCTAAILPPPFRPLLMSPPTK